MSARQSIRRLRERNRGVALALRGLVRRFTVALAPASGLWQLLGLADADGSRERLGDVEQFPGIGFFARPKEAGAEAVVVHVGGETGHPVIVATRDRRTQVALEPDETCVFTSRARVHLRRDGTVYVTDASGAGEPLATKSDLDALRDWIELHTHPSVGAPNEVATLPAATGTTVLMSR
jgi:phage gp45-like